MALHGSAWRCALPRATAARPAVWQVIVVDPALPPGEGTRRTELFCPDYEQIVIYDHEKTVSVIEK